MARNLPAGFERNMLIIFTILHFPWLFRGSTGEYHPKSNISFEHFLNIFSSKGCVGDWDHVQLSDPSARLFGTPGAAGRGGRSLHAAERLCRTQLQATGSGLVVW